MNETRENFSSELSEQVRIAALSVMSKWVAALSDKLTNPIAGMMAALDLVDSNLIVDQNSKDSIVKVRLRLRSLADFVQELVDYSRPVRFVRQSVDLKLLFNSVEEIVKPILPQGCNLTMIVEPGAEKFEADFGKLQRAFCAIIENAIEAVRPPKIPIVSVTGRYRSERATLEISFEDNGCGFSHETIGSVTDPFFSTKEAGTGMGLAVAQKIIVAHQGSIEFRQGEDLGGALVLVKLPLYLPIQKLT